jgi:predicted GNAT family N-acyltransferase
MISIKRASSKSDFTICTKIRKKVFVEEQSVPEELELDKYDYSKETVHYLCVDSAGGAVATGRICYGDQIAKIGRLAVLKEYRGQGIGHKILRQMLADITQNKVIEARLAAQTYAIPFYEKLGFIAHGEEFMDAGIPHVNMRLQLYQVSD